MSNRDEKYIATNPLSWRSLLPASPTRTADGRSKTEAAGDAESESLVVGPQGGVDASAHLGVVIPYARNPNGEAL